MCFNLALSCTRVCVERKYTQMFLKTKYTPHKQLCRYIITIMATASLTETSDAQTHKRHLDCDQSASISVRLFVMSSSGGLSLLCITGIHTLHKMWHWDTQGEVHARSHGHNTCSGDHWSMYTEEEMDTNRFIHSKAFFLHIKNRSLCVHTGTCKHTHGQILWLFC